MRLLQKGQAVTPRKRFNPATAAHALATVTNGNGRRAGVLDTRESSVPYCDSNIVVQTAQQATLVSEYRTVLVRCVRSNAEVGAGSPAVFGSEDTWEDARRAGVDGSQCTIPPGRDCQVWIDCELGRVAICRHELPEYRMWLYGHQLANGSGRILRSELSGISGKLGLVTNRSTFNGIIARGNRLYWRERDGYLYLTSWKKLASKLTKWQAKYEPDHVATNRPGQRRVQLDLTGSLKLAHALIYNGWIAVKSEKLGYLEISRWTLERLWGRNRRQLRSWEALVGIRTEARYAENTDIHNPQIPAHATLCLDKGGGEFSTWQLSNRIYPANTTISNTKGQGRKVRSAANHAYNSIETADLKHGGLLRVQRTGRLYFTERSGKNGNVSPYKQIDKHLIKHGDIFQRQHYAYLTTRYGKHIYEYSFDGTQSRSAHCERDRLGEQGVEFRLRRMQYRIGWVYRML